MDTSINHFNDVSIGQSAGLGNRSEHRKEPRVSVTFINRGELSKAEARTVKYALEGLERPTIADRIHRSLSTVNTQLEAAYRKLGAHGATHALALCVARGLITIEENAKLMAICLTFGFAITATIITDTDANRNQTRTAQRANSVKRQEIIG